MSSYHNKEITYRPEIDGLRAVAVIPVILFHAGFELFSGGFVGVDIFFVISGYLITSIILREIEQGNFSILRFYERRARRLLPALFFVILCTLPLAWLFLFPQELRNFGKSIVAVGLFASNFYFWRTEDYFAPTAEDLPLLHTWSLAVEEQYYLLFPLFLIVSWRFGRPSLVWLILGAAILSLMISEYGWREQPVANFYLLPTRAWELLAGSLLAFIPKVKAKEYSTGVLSQAGSIIGLLLILLSMFTFDRMTPFPSVYALVPVIGTALIIIFGSSNNLIGKILSIRPVVGLGLVSYSAYLWHQPVLVFGNMLLPGLGEVTEFLLVLASLGLAWFTWRYVENYFRRDFSLNHSSSTKVICIASMSLAMMVVVGGFLAGPFISESIIPSAGKEPIRAESKCFDFPFRSLSTSTELPECIIGEKSKQPDFVILADSQVLGHINVIDQILKMQKKSALVYGTSSCAPIFGVFPVRNDDRKYDCFHMKRLVMETLEDRSIKNVILIGRWTYYREGGVIDDALMQISDTDLSRPLADYSADTFDKLYRKSIEVLNKMNVSVRVLGGPPESFEARVAKNYYRSMFFVPLNKLETIQNQGRVKAADEIVAQGADGFVSLLEGFCDLNKSSYRCYVGDSQGAFYLDDDHISEHGSSFVQEDLKKLFID